MKILNPHVAYLESKIVCPTHCGLCIKHKSHTGLGNVVVTNRCDLSCWYCFFYAKENEPIYEPSQDQVRMMLRECREVQNYSSYDYFNGSSNPARNAGIH